MVFFKLSTSMFPAFSSAEGRSRNEGSPAFSPAKENAGMTYEDSFIDWCQCDCRHWFQCLPFIHGS